MKEYICHWFESSTFLVPSNKEEEFRSWVLDYYRGTLEDYNFPDYCLTITDEMKVYIKDSSPAPAV